MALKRSELCLYVGGLAAEAFSSSYLHFCHSSKISFSGFSVQCLNKFAVLPQLQPTSYTQCSLWNFHSLLWNSSKTTLLFLSAFTCRFKPEVSARDLDTVWVAKCTQHNNTSGEKQTCTNLFSNAQYYTFLLSNDINTGTTKKRETYAWLGIDHTDTRIYFKRKHRNWQHQLPLVEATSLLQWVFFESTSIFFSLQQQFAKQYTFTVLSASVRRTLYLMLASLTFLQ